MTSQKPILTALECPEDRAFPFTREHFDFLRGLSFQHSGIVVGDNKFDMFYARLVRRVRHLGLDGFDSYCGLLESKDSPEFGPFINAITTNLTSFFRESHHFDFLSRHLLDETSPLSVHQQRLRIWSAGCSSGEEPWSIAMCLAAAREQVGVASDALILATDLNSEVLEKADKGCYDQEVMQPLDSLLQERWFERQGNCWGASDELRDLVRFRQLNLMQEWPMQGKMQAIFCRNVIIYFDNETKKELVARLREKLVPGGYLFVGHSESLCQASDGLKLVDKTVYQRID